jgi:hypothetical protein
MTVAELTETRATMLAAYRAGAEAKADGLTAAECPYSPTGGRAERSARILWLKGFALV